MENKKLRPKQIVVVVPEELVGIQLIFRLRKGGRVIDFGTIKKVRKEGNEVKLEFDPDKPGVGKLIKDAGKGRTDV